MVAFDKKWKGYNTMSKMKLMTSKIKRAPIINLPEDWVAFYTPKVRDVWLGYLKIRPGIFYYNVSTKTSHWVHPLAPKPKGMCTGKKPVNTFGWTKVRRGWFSGLL